MATYLIPSSKHILPAYRFTFLEHYCLFECFESSNEGDTNRRAGPEKKGTSDTSQQHVHFTSKQVTKNKVKKSDISHARERASEVIAAVRHWKCHATIAREVGQTRVAPRKMFNRCDTGKFCSSISANRSGISFTALEAAVNPSFFHLFLSFYFSRFTLHKWQSPTKTTHTVGRLLWNQPLLALLLVNILSCDNCNLHSHRPCINNSSSSSQARHQQRLNQV